MAGGSEITEHLCLAHEANSPLKSTEQQEEYVAQRNVQETKVSRRPFLKCNAQCAMLNIRAHTCDAQMGSVFCGREGKEQSADAVEYLI